jgi:hypothetical protein
MAKKEAAKPKKKPGKEKAAPAPKAASTAKPKKEAGKAPKVEAKAGKSASSGEKGVIAPKSKADSSKSKKSVEAVPQPAVSSKKPAEAKAKPMTLSSAGAELETGKKKASGKAASVVLKPANDPELQKLQQKWLSLYEKAKGQPAPEYNMTKVFEPKSALQHKTLGWGYILSNQYDRLEVLFQDGIRFLISNYKKP